MSRYELNQAIDEVIDKLTDAVERRARVDFEALIEKLDALRDRLMHEGLI